MSTSVRVLLVVCAFCLRAEGVQESWRDSFVHGSSQLRQPGGLRLRGGGVNSVDGKYLHGGEDR